MSRVLVVDDYPDGCTVLVRRLAHAGIDARSAASGPEALSIIRADRPEVVLLDLWMPNMDGLAVLKDIRADPRFDAVAVLMYTAVIDLDSQLKALAMGAQGYIDKGTPFDDLRAELDRRLTRA